jgi:4,5-DOPA dioxygenase extradiol
VTDDWGLDHGTWSVLRHMVPDHDVPVVQLSLDGRLTPARHFELARELQELRAEGVLVLGSGNVTHNLRDALARASAREPTTPAWAAQFDREVARALVERDTPRLLKAWPEGEHAQQAHPHPDHWLPLLYAYAATEHSDSLSFPIEGFDLGSLSMRAVRWG